ncbi:MAG: molybdopterin-dependent oxidoreductase [Eggerthellaceae bacterium]|nr:molybdopterin-dependent oxidoreductase [Eggerthellaceae bacterium]
MSLTVGAQGAIAQGAQAEETVGYGVCRSNCMQSCRYAAHVRDGKIVRLEPAEYSQDLYRGSCLRGMSYMHRIYGSERIKYPMRRVDGTERGAGEWERISWDDAISEIADHFKETIETYGPTAVAFTLGTGNYGEMHGATGIFARLGNVMGVTSPAGIVDLATGYGIDRVLGTGLMYFANEAKSVLDSSHVVIWGSNPVHSAPQNWRWIQHAKEQGTQVLTIDPIKSATAHKSDVYVPIKPTTDGYLALAMARYIVENNLQNDDFIRNRTTAPLLVRRDTGLLLRKSDFEEVPVDPETQEPIDEFYVWDAASNSAVLFDEAVDPALEGSFEVNGVEVDTSYSLLKNRLMEYSVDEAVTVTGVPKETIIELANLFANSRAVSVNISFGMDHYDNGYQSCWAIAILMALAGQLGRDGAGFTGIYLNTNLSLNIPGLWAAPGFKGMVSNIPWTLFHEVVAKQEWEGGPFPVKAMLTAISNPASNWGASNGYFDDIVPNLDFHVVLDMEMTDTARYADMVLPVASFYEVEDFRKAHNFPYIVHQDQVIDPLYEAKSDVEIAGLIGRAMGHEDAFPAEYGFEEYARMLLSGPSVEAAGVSLDRLREEQYIELTPIPGKAGIVGRTQFPTVTGRAQLYTELPAPRLIYGQPTEERFAKEHLVYYQESTEVSENSEAAKKFPIVFIQEHTRWRTHSQWFNSPLLRELDPEPIFKISAQDAKERGIVDGDIVEVFNDRGKMVVKCVIDPSLPTGMSRMPKGWQRDQFIEGGYQELTYPLHDEWAVAASYSDARVDAKRR